MNWRVALAFLIIAVLMLIVGAIPFFVVLFLGVAWGIIACAVVGVALAIIAEREDSGAGLDVIVLGGVAVIIGGICGLAARVVWVLS